MKFKIVEVRKMDKLLEMRKELDKIDEEIIRLYKERMKVCEQIGDYKGKVGKRVLDPERENEKLRYVSNQVEGEFNKKGIRELFNLLMSLSREIQYQRIAGK